MKRKISDITIGKRHRHDMGDLDELANSIKEVDLLHPVVIQPTGKLIAGARRLAACRRLGWESIPVTVIDLDKVVQGEYAENVFRKAFTPSEAVAIADAIEPVERAKAKEEQQQAGERGKEGGRGKRKTLTGNSRKGKRAPTALDKVGKATGKDRKSLAKARAVVHAAQEQPEKFGKLADDMDQTGNIDRAFKQLKINQAREDYEARADRGANSDDLVEMAEAGKQFAVIYADPPWEYKVYSGKGKQRSAERYYDTSSLEAIKALPVTPLAADNCALFIWGVWPELPGILEIIKAWGFEYKTTAFVWVKQNSGGEGLFWGMGYWTRANTEFCLLATRGSPTRMAEDVHQIILSPHPGKHSQKPEEARARIQRLLTGPYLELFARCPVPGWTTWGNEVESEMRDAIDRRAIEAGQVVRI